MLTPSQIESYHENGYVVVPDVIGPGFAGEGARDARRTDRKVARGLGEQCGL